MEAANTSAITKASEYLRGKGIGFQRVLALAILLTVLVSIGVTPPQARTFDNIAKIVEIGLLAMGLLSIGLLSAQIRQTAAWNQSLFYHQFFGDLVSRAQSLEMRTILRDAQVLDAFLKCEQVDETTCTKFVEDDDLQTFITSYLDEFEEFCAAINRGLLDYNYAMALEGKRVSRSWHFFEPMILKIRASNGDPCCYIELETIAKRWVDFEKNLSAKMVESQKTRRAFALGS